MACWLAYFKMLPDVGDPGIFGHNVDVLYIETFQINSGTLNLMLPLVLGHKIYILIKHGRWRQFVFLFLIAVTCQHNHLHYLDL